MEQIDATQENVSSHSGRSWKGGDWPTPQQVQQCSPKIHTFTEFVSYMPFTLAIIDCRFVKTKKVDCLVAKARVQQCDIPVNEDTIEFWIPKSLRFRLKDNFEKKKVFPFWTSVDVKKDKRSFCFDVVQFTPFELDYYDWSKDACETKDADFYTSFIKKFNEEIEDEDDSCSLSECDMQNSTGIFAKRYSRDAPLIPMKKRRF